MSRYYLVKNYQDTKWRDVYFDHKDFGFTANIRKISMFRDKEDVEAFKYVMEFYGHNGLVIKEIG
jgi:hypothetical protein